MRQKIYLRVSSKSKLEQLEKENEIYKSIVETCNTDVTTVALEVAMDHISDLQKENAELRMIIDQLMCANDGCMCEDCSEERNSEAN